MRRNGTDDLLATDLETGADGGAWVGLIRWCAAGKQPVTRLLPFKRQTQLTGNIITSGADRRRAKKKNYLQTILLEHRNAELGLGHVMTGYDVSTRRRVIERITDYRTYRVLQKPDNSCASDIKAVNTCQGNHAVI